MTEPLRIAMWSGPRNLSTTMMRSFSRRADCAVVDEPFYGVYLAATGLDHPMREQIMAGMEADPGGIAEGLAGPAPGGAAVFYQKHMTQHMVPGMPRDWMAATRGVFLIRHPARVVASYAAKREAPTLEDLGFVQQADILADSTDPIIVDADDILRNPEAMLRALCAALGLDWDPAMLSWPAGPDPADGIWGQHWYGAIWASTGFAPWTDRPLPQVDAPDIMGPAIEIYDAMHRARLTGD